ncbi:hypothetical protein P4O66_014541 [Electrophorus voltai]|uniref:Sleeping Beauty transposase HTH domain-containing protein n=1 Tax=Electrophorus voltai TaxID=2609070 RepID=A0AAD8Z0I6_9TELE|nr:hypothetical protein P4O66_014541 [Electrophorus voltai]
MLQSKEIQEQMRYKVIEIYQSGKGYKAISKALGLQRTTVRTTIGENMEQCGLVSPDLNPIEMLWHDLKKVLHARKTLQCGPVTTIL